ncbi:MAG: hypothetical protein DMG62_24760 [Acidobacteria bacterium]|nr:MAG: hypothetical protein DMG62_24760 [Acidobacteriota bacterium]
MGFVQIRILSIYYNPRGRKFSAPRLGTCSNPTAPRRNNFVGIAICIYAVQRAQLTIRFERLALAKIAHDGDSPEGGTRCVGIKIYPFVPSSNPLSWSPAPRP